MEKFLEQSTYIDWGTPEVRQLAERLSEAATGDEVVAKRCFEWVRDSIRHSSDYKQNPVTCRASEVLRHGTGYCYAKSHLLAALLRANSIPADLCYQRLSVEGDGAPHCLHGLVAVHLKAHGWYRIDPRGNKQGVDAQFTPPVERLAFSILLDGEADLPEIWHEPHPIIPATLERFATYDAVFANLPDILLLPRSTTA